MEVESVVKHLVEKNITIGAAESITGGLFASTLASVPGVSKVFKGSIVSYSSEVKESVLGVDPEIIKTVGVVSKEVALQMAKNAKSILNVDLAVSFTGNAGPTAIEDKPVGLIFMGIAYLNKVKVFKLQLNGSREEIREKCIEYALRLINEKII